ncbi:endothelin-converting enzyme 2-like isoform X3 [Paramuricea clavata]|uniref:Endothelin-converting enzyme 2-like isoform X3 n=1 Tax=Paramuricea clavata TaxID=317549 RepID=A0A6S7IU96_PARCT|nr:endothelin-converting enzyme 2-like isoform X3 [Paramuricea clavata]
MVHSNNVSTMPAFDPKNRSFSQKTKLEKFLFAFVVILFAIVGLLLYFYLIKIPKEVGIYRDEKSKQTNDGPEICTKQNCVLNAANLMEKMDQSVDPCDDFYSYACGGYDSMTPIPSHLNFIHVLKQLQDDNTKHLKMIVENTKLREYYAKQNPAVSKLLQAYDICMNHNNFEETTLSSFKKLIRSLGDSNITSKEWNKDNYNIFDAMVKGMRLKFNPFFSTGVWINPKNSSKHVFFITKPTLGLRAKSYLPKKTPRDEKIRDLYREYMITMLKSVASNPRDVPAAVDGVLRLEKRIAKILARFNDDYSALTIEELSRFTKFDWLSFFQNLANDVKYYTNNEDVILVNSKAIIKHINTVIATTDKHVLSNYIVWKVLQDSIPALPSELSRTEHKFKNNIRSRMLEQTQRWETCVEILSESFHKVLSHLYVEQRFSEDSRRKAFEIFHDIRREFVEDLKNKTWMDEKTKTAAAEKARGIHFLAGYTDDTNNIEEMNTVFQKLQINRSNFFETYLNQRSLVFKNNLKNLLHPVQKNSFEELTWNANAYYSRQENKISFLAGILQRPIYDRNNSRASNYGSLGMIVGHELTHAFDSKGHMFDKNGNQRNWWTSNSLKNFQERTACFTEQYNKFTILGESVRGKNTLGENIADNGGLKLAYNAFKRSEKQNGAELQLPGLNLTNDQVFFLSFAQVWCSKYTKDALEDTIKYHVPMMFRVTGPLRNSVEFSRAYRCPVGSRMNPAQKCGVW